MLDSISSGEVVDRVIGLGECVSVHRTLLEPGVAVVRVVRVRQVDATRYSTDHNLFASHHTLRCLPVLLLYPHMAQVLQNLRSPKVESSSNEEDVNIKH